MSKMNGKTKITDFYCNQKFTWLSIDLEKRLTYSCCEADPTKINLSWLKQNPGKIFNTELLQQERQSMLDNIPVVSCNTGCWIPEKAGLTSQRIQVNGIKKTHTNLISIPEKLHIIVGSACNLTCSYCEKQNSTAWLYDIANYGGYLDAPRFTINPIDQAVLKISQKEQMQSEGFKLLLDEIKSFKNLKETVISGGEPFLYNNFIDILNGITDSKEIIFFTGLGVNHTRLQNQLDKIKDPTNITATISAENIKQFYEFNRYGNSYQDFCKNLALLKEYKFKIKFSSVVSNLTIHGLIDFVNEVGDENISYIDCVDPTFLRTNVLDPKTIDRLVTKLDDSNISIKSEIIKNLLAPSTNEQRNQCSIFLKEFARRRNLSLDIFPKSMLQWLSI